MLPKVLNVSEARRQLPGLVRNAEHSGAIGIGTRGNAAAVLLGIQDYEALRAKASQAKRGGWEHLRLEVTTTFEDVESELVKMREERAAAVPKMPGKRRRQRGR